MSSAEINHKVGGVKWTPDQATQFFVRLKTANSNQVNFRVRSGNWVGQRGTPWEFTLANYDFTGALQALSYTNDFGGLNIQDPAFNVQSGTLTQIDIPGDDTGSLHDYGISISGSNLDLVMGFYIWADQAASSSGFTFDLGDGYWAANQSTTCLVQLGNQGGVKYQAALGANQEDQVKYIAWAKS